MPTVLLDYVRKFRYSHSKSRFKDKSIEETFHSIYKQNVWGSTTSVSGQGSTKAQSSQAVQMLEGVFYDYKIGSVLDLPCGDFNWMKFVDLSGVDYLGGDIVEELIETNSKYHGADHIRFQRLNVIDDKLPPADLIVVRDCFVHFSYKDIFKSIENIKRSKCRYMLTTTFTKQRVNYDIVTGDWRPINLLRPPFNFPKPLAVVQENYVQAFKNDFRGKSLALWEIADIKS